MNVHVATIDIGKSKACLALISNIGNGHDIKKLLIEGKLSAALINCNNILDSWQLQVATFKACTAESRGKMITRNIYSEIIFSLSPNRQISQAFKLFGMRDTDTACVAITIGESRESDMQKLSEVVSGPETAFLPLESLSNFNSVDSIKKTYGVEDIELTVGTLSEAVVGRIAAKDLLT